MYQKMMDKEFGIKAIAFIFSVSEESIKKILMKAQKIHYKTGENMVRQFGVVDLVRCNS